MNTLDDPRPIPPEKPLPMDCCDSGCDRCVSDIYEEELEHFQAALFAWEARQARHLRGVGDTDAGLA